MRYNSKYLRLLVHRLPVLLPLLLIFVGMAGIVITGVIMNRPDLTLRSLVLVIPLILAGVLLLLLNTSRNKSDAMPTFRWPRFSHLVMIFTTLSILSIIILYINNHRPLEYFIIVSFISGLIFLQILQCDSRIKRSIILVEISALSLCLIWGVTLNYPLYYGWTDVLPHLNIIDSIITSGHIAGRSNYYGNFPLFHTIISISYYVCGLPLQTTHFLVTGLIWPIGIIVTYLIFRKFSDSTPLVLIACLLFAMNAEVIQYGAYSITRSFAFILYLFAILTLLPSKNHGSKTFFIQVIFSIALILTHHFTALLALFIFIILSMIYNYVSKNTSDEKVSDSFVMLYGVAFLSYLFYVAHTFTGSIWSRFISLLTSDEAATVIDVAPGRQSGIFFIIEHSYAAFALFLSLLGIGYLLSNKDKYIRKKKFIILLCLFSLPLFVPGAQYLLSIVNDSMVYRIALLVSPFIVFGMALGIWYLLGYRGKVKQSKRNPTISIALICAAIVFASTFSSMLSNSNNSDSPDLNFSGIDRGYFSAPEVSSLLFIGNNAERSLPLFSDYYVVRNTYHLGDFHSRNILTDEDDSYLQGGYVVLRMSELSNMDVSSSPYDSYLSREGNIIYDNGAVKAFLIHSRNAFTES